MKVTLRLKRMAKKVDRYYLDIYDRGYRNREMLDIYIYPDDSKNSRVEKKEMANRVRALRELEYTSETYGFVAKHKQRADFFLYYEHFLSTYKKKDIRMQENAFDKFKHYYGKTKMPMRVLNRRVCQEFADYLKNEAGLSGETPNNYFSRFKRVVTKAFQDGLIKENPTAGIRVTRKSNQMKKQILTIEELRQLANTSCGNETIRDTFLFACFTGLGQAEIENLTWASISLPNKKISILRQKSREQITNDLPETAVEILKRYVDQSKGAKSRVFPSLPSTNGTNKTIQNWIDRAGISKKITFYCARHTFAVMLLLNGANLKTVADCLGHASTQHTLKYLNYVDALKSEAIASLQSL